MKAALVALCLAALAFVCTPAMAMERGPYSIEVLVDGVPVPEHFSRGTTYIQAFEGRAYSIRLRNHTGERVAVALSVDGLNTIDAKRTSAREASKWILDPYQTIDIGGWQTSSATARRFFFTTEPRSYGAWLGETRNLGIIAAAVFRERHRRQQYWEENDSPRPMAPEPQREGSRLQKAPQESAESGSADSRSSERRKDLSGDHAATGIGREDDHSVVRVHFDAERSPAAVMQLRYEYRDALVRLGLLPRWDDRRRDPLDRREGACGFEDMGFSPDPYRRRCR